MADVAGAFDAGYNNTPLSDAADGSVPLAAEEAPASSSESFEALAVLTQMTLILVVMVVGWYLEKKHVTALSEAAVGLIVGIGVGGAVLVSTPPTAVSPYSHWMNFDPEFFFFVLLPPIIFDAGYSLDPKYFFGNFGAICCLAFVGTFVSTVIIGLVVWLAGWAGLCYRLNLLQSGLFGSLISATDPVTTLAILGNVRADQNLYYLIFGESVLNDAVAIVMYKTLNEFQHNSFSLASVGKAVGFFLLIFVGSCGIGAITALLCSLFYKLTDSKKSQAEHYNIVEACLLVPVPIVAYFAAEGLKLSGIVSILFCGIVMARYTRRNLSDKTSELSLFLFKVLAKVSEAFVFIYMGLSLFLADQAFESWRTWTLFAISFLAMLGARTANVFPNCHLVNKTRSPQRQISKRHQQFLWFSGLRGGIAFALAMRSTEDVGKETGTVMFSATLLIVLVTVLVFGGLTPMLLSRLGVLAGGSSREYTQMDMHPDGRASLEENTSFDVHQRKLSDPPSALPENGRSHRSIELSESAMSEGTDEGEEARTGGEAEQERDAHESRFRRFVRTASGSVTLDHINFDSLDKSIEKVFVSP